MAGNTAIRDVGDSLINLLKSRMTDLPDGAIILGSPGDVKSEVKLTLFLYQVIENVHMRNQEMIPIGSTGQRYPPLVLDLFYIMTSYPSTAEDTTEKALDAHQLLGRAMQVFYDNTILRGTYLEGNIGENEELHITVNNLSLDELTKIWTTFPGKQFKPSVCYLVTPVIIDSSRNISIQRVTEKQTGYKEPGV